MLWKCGFLGIIVLIAAVICPSVYAFEGASDSTRKDGEQKSSDTQFGSLSITSTPLGANIYLGGVYQRRTPRIIKNLRIGEHEIRLTKPNYEETLQKIIVDANIRNDVHITLTETPEYIQKRIAGVYGNATVWRKSKIRRKKISIFSSLAVGVASGIGAFSSQDNIRLRNTSLTTLGASIALSVYFFIKRVPNQQETVTQLLQEERSEQTLILAQDYGPVDINADNPANDTTEKESSEDTTPTAQNVEQLEESSAEGGGQKAEVKNKSEIRNPKSEIRGETVPLKIVNFEGHILKITENGFYISRFPDAREGMDFIIAKSDPVPDSRDGPDKDGAHLQNITARVQVITLHKRMLEVRLLTREAKRHFTRIGEKVNIIVKGN